jgi:hypothetical protein
MYLKCVALFKTIQNYFKLVLSVAARISFKVTFVCESIVNNSDQLALLYSFMTSMQAYGRAV